MESEQTASAASQECHNKYMELGKKRRFVLNLNKELLYKFKTIIKIKLNWA
jgi:hypothetical protein